MRKFRLLTRTSTIIDAPLHEEIVYADEIADDYHTMHDLYEHRLALTVALFNYMHAVHASIIGESAAKIAPITVKSKLHNDGTMFEGGYFIVSAMTANGQISYHYDLKHWDKFRIPEVERVPWKYDNHKPEDVIERLINLV